MKLATVAAAWERVAAVSKRLAKVDELAAVLTATGSDELPLAVAFLSGELPQGSIGVGPAMLGRVDPAPVRHPELTLVEVNSSLDQVAAATGAGSTELRYRLLSELLGRATAAEQRFLRRLLLGDLRQGALEGVMADAIARAAGVSASKVRRALMLSGDPGLVATLATAEGEAGLAALQLRLFRPLQPMLAQSADDLAAAFARISPAVVEWKVDGARVQVHRRDDEIRVYSRNLADNTDRLPELVTEVRALPVQSIVLDGEAISVRSDGSPHPFQVTMSRFGTDTLGRRRGLTARFFDCLHLDGVDLLDRPNEARFEALAEVVPADLLLPRRLAAGPSEADPFLAEAVAAGFEGVMVKDPSAPYAAGRRGAAWLKVKPVHTLDLVVLAAEWGHGRRRGWLSNLHLGARAPDGGFVMLGKTFKGLTDQMLAWQTERFLELETHREAHVVHVRPEQVVEVAFDGVQDSTRYPGGVALRFARVKGYRSDKSAEEADTLATVRSYLP